MPFCKPHFVRPKPPPPGIRPKLVPAGGYSPAAILQAIKQSPLKAVKPIHLGYVTLGGATNQSDITGFFTKFQTAAPIFNVKLCGGLTSLPPTDPNGANVENHLDAQWLAGIASAALGKSIPLTAYAAPNSDTGIPDAILAALADGCTHLSISWGAPGASGAYLAALNSALAQAFAGGMKVSAASGDNSADDGTRGRAVDYPAACVRCWGVGGVSLQIDAAGNLLSVSAWGDGNAADEGGGGGQDATQIQPIYQVGIAPPGGRDLPDCAFLADPATGGAVLSDGVWQIVGGTSLASPAFMGLIAAYDAAGAVWGADWFATLYAAIKTAFTDVVTGSDGNPTKVGYDLATGCGLPYGPGLAATLLSATAPPPVQPPPINPPPVVQPPPPVGTSPPAPVLPPGLEPAVAHAAETAGSDYYGGLRLTILRPGVYRLSDATLAAGTAKIDAAIRGAFAAAVGHAEAVEPVRSSCDSTTHTYEHSSPGCEITLEVTHRHD